MEKENDSMICGASLALVGYKDEKPVQLAYRFVLPTDKFADLLAQLRELRESYKDSYDSVLIHLETIHTQIID